MKRENFATRLGFLLVSAGCAIGIGNVWRFPFVTGQNGGGLFVALYLLFLLIMGVPVMTMELALGRGGKSSAVNAFRELEPKGTKWHLHGWACMIGCYILMMYYTTVAGWMLSYLVKFAAGSFGSMNSEEVAGVFTSLLASPGQMALWMAITVVAGFLTISFGLQSGLERIAKFMMCALMVLIIVLAVHSLGLPNASRGIAFYLLPSLERASQAGIGKVITAAMNQAFFTLSLGIGSMQIFGSYMSDERTLGGESVRIAVLDTFVAIMSGLIIFPACFAFDIETTAGPPLIFITLPNIFVNMAGGRLWGTLFFLFMTFASFTTVIAVFENIVAFWMDNFGFERKKACYINMVILFVGSLPCVFGYNIWSELRLIGARDVLDSEDFIVSNLLLPIGALIYLLFSVTKLGWGYEKYMAEANKGEGFKLPQSKVFRYYLQYVLPILILVILVMGLLPS